MGHPVHPKLEFLNITVALRHGRPFSSLFCLMSLAHLCLSPRAGRAWAGTAQTTKSRSKRARASSMWLNEYLRISLLKSGGRKWHEHDEPADGGLREVQVYPSFVNIFVCICVMFVGNQVQHIFLTFLIILFPKYFRCKH